MATDLTKMVKGTHNLIDVLLAMAKQIEANEAEIEKLKFKTNPKL